MAIDRQGNLPALETMSKVELQDLLNRQEKILANKNFLRTLPDKGKKIETFADKLKQVIKEKEDVEKAAQLFERMDLGASCVAEEGVIERIPKVISSNQEDQMQTTDAKPMDKQSNSIPNTFLKTNTNVKKKEPFLPYKSLKSTSIPKDFPKPNVQQGKASTGRTSSSGGARPVDVSAVAPPPMRHPGTKAVELEESTQLLETQKKKVDELIAQHAAEKLAERMHMKLEQYNPASPDMRYRDPNEEDEEEDSDDDDDDDDDIIDEVEEPDEGEND
ncbi:uncharacterized protein [Amphiura filiformis]|uniref:uncharacterized protein n=1 Tax=Amphiura filiformis TaxID=82378 RepID=UPI003B2184B4